MLKKFQNLKESAPGLAIDARFLIFWNFVALQCFVSFRFGNFGIFWALQCFVVWTSQNTVMLTRKTNISQPQGSQNLSIAVFRGLNLTKHCNAQKNNFSKPWNPRNTVMLKTFQSFKESALGLAIDARILEFLKFFEHGSVSWVSGLEILELFEHYSVSWCPGQGMPYHNRTVSSQPLSRTRFAILCVFRNRKGFQSSLLDKYEQGPPQLVHILFHVCLGGR